MEKEKAYLKSKEPTAAAISHVVFKAEVKVLQSDDINDYLFPFLTLFFTVAVGITEGEQMTKHEDDSRSSEDYSTIKMREILLLSH